MAPMSLRERAWEDLASLLDTSLLSEVYRIEPMSHIKSLASAILRGEIKGRVVIDVNA